MNFDVGEKMVYIYPILIGFMILEFFGARENYKDLKDTAAGFGIALGASIVASFTKAFTVVYVFQFVFDVMQPVREALFGYSAVGWAWWAWILCQLGDDFSFYWHHRWSHTIRLLWAAHVPHHSSKQFNLSVSIRNGWFITLYKPIFWLWLPALGFDPIMVGTALIINATYQYFLHTRTVKDMGLFGKIFNTPYVHQVHHSSNVEYLDKNHGGILLIWDKLFGTWQPVIDDLEPKYGILKDPGTYNPIRLNTHEFEAIWQDLKKSSKIKDKFMYIFGPPGWSHDGSSMTAKEIQAQYALNRQPA